MAKIPIRSKGTERVRRLLYGLQDEPARVAIIGDSQSSVAQERMMTGMWRTWNLDWAALPIPSHGAAPTNGGYNMTPGTSVTEIPTEMGNTPQAVINTYMAPLTEYTSSVNLADTATIATLRHDLRSPKGNLFTQFSGSSTIRGIVYYNGVVNAANYNGGTALMTAATGTAGSPVTMLYGDNVRGATVTRGNLTAPHNVNILIRADTSNETGLPWSTLGAVVGVDDAANSWFLQDPKRPIFLSNVFRAGANWSDYADSTNFGGTANPAINWSWTDYGEMMDIISVSLDSQRANVIFLMVGHNDGHDAETPAVIAADVANAISNLKTAIGIGHDPQIVLIHAWQTGSMANVQRWRDIWTEAYLGNVDDNVCAVSIAEFQKYVIHSDQLDVSDIHPGSLDGTSFMYGHTGLLGALTSPLSHRHRAPIWNRRKLIRQGTV